MPASTNASYVGRLAPPGYPNTTSTPSAFRHSITASTARICARTSFLRSRHGKSRAPAAPGTGDCSFSGARGRAHELAVVGELELHPAAGAQGVVQLADAPAVGTHAARLLVVDAVEHGGDEADDGHHARDEEPQEEGAALQPADEAAGEGERQRDDDVDHRRRGLELTEGPEDGDDRDHDRQDRGDARDEADDELEEQPGDDREDDDGEGAPGEPARE